MTLHIPKPEDKVRYLTKRKVDPGQCIAVGDGYTEIPMLDWAKMSVLADRTGRKQINYVRILELYSLNICKYNLQVAMDKEDCGLVAVMRHPNKLRVAHIYTIVDKKLS